MRGQEGRFDAQGQEIRSEVSGIYPTSWVHLRAVCLSERYNLRVGLRVRQRSLQ